MFLYKKGDDIEAIILSMDADKERISLGIKQLINDPFLIYVDNCKKSSIVFGKVVDVTQKGCILSLSEDVFGYLKISEISKDRVENIKTIINIGDDIYSKVIGFDKKNRYVLLSIKAKNLNHLESQKFIENIKSLEGSLN